MNDFCRAHNERIFLIGSDKRKGFLGEAITAAGSRKGQAGRGAWRAKKYHADRQGKGMLISNILCEVARPEMATDLKERPARAHLAFSGSFLHRLDRVALEMRENRGQQIKINGIILDEEIDNEALIMRVHAGMQNNGFDFGFVQ
ncbi:hypothetical protein [uncultured Cohaesibacter sp.]|uniref:hypothetical protein n=1 Tax=uncultured Cohaesibacter sp. TaxID=1002546 RepID=UPI002AA76584|nr:hypothetical protein [uncultured Cohaesibacter sp.]